MILYWVAKASAAAGRQQGYGRSLSLPLLRFISLLLLAGAEGQRCSGGLSSYLSRSRLRTTEGYLSHRHGNDDTHRCDPLGPRCLAGPQLMNINWAPVLHLAMSVFNH